MKILIGKYEPYQKVTSTITKTSAPTLTSSRKVLQGKYQPKSPDYSASKSQLLATAKQAEGRTTAGDLKSAAAGILSSSEPIVRPSQKVDVSVFDPKEYIRMTDEERARIQAAADSGNQFDAQTRAEKEYAAIVSAKKQQQGANMAQRVQDNLSGGTETIARTVVLPFAEGMRQGLTNPVRTPEALLGKVSVPDQMQYAKRESDANMGDFARMVSGASEGIGRIAAARVMGGGIGNPSAVAPKIGQVASAFDIANSSYRDAIAEGKSKQNAFAYGVAMGAMEGVTNKLLGGIPGLSEGTAYKALGKVFRDVAKRIASSPMADNLLSAAGRISSEAFEEWFQANLEDGVRNVIFDEKNELKPFSKEKLYEALAGGVTSFVLNAGSLGFKAIDSAAQKRANRQSSQMGEGSTAAEPSLIEQATGLTGEVQTEDNEVAANRQKFVDDPSRYENSYAKQTVQNAIDTGMMNNSKETHDFVDFAAKIAADKSYVVEFTTTQKLREQMTNGNPYDINVDPNRVQAFVSDKNQKIVINLDAKKSFNFLVGHELTDTMRKAKVYDRLQKAAFAYAETKGELNSRLESVKKRYAGVNADINGELTSDIVGDYVFNDYDFLLDLATKEQNVFQHLWNEVKHLYKLATAGSKEARQLETLKHNFEKAYREANSKTNNGTTYDLVALEDGKVYVKASRKVINGATKAEQRKEISNFFSELLEDNESLDIPTIDGDVLTITKADTADKARDDHKSVNKQKVKMSDDEFAVKLRVESHIDEIAETSTKTNAKSDEKKHSFARDGFTYRKAYFEDFDGQYYEVTLSIGHNGTVATVYNVGKIKEGVPPSAKIIAVVGSKPLGETPSKSSIPQNIKNVNTNFSMGKVNERSASDSDGNQNNIRHALFEEGEAVKDYGGWNVYGRDILLQDSATPSLIEQTTGLTGQVQTETAEQEKAPDNTFRGRASRLYDRALVSLNERLGNAFPSVREEYIQPVAEKMAAEYMQTGAVSKETADSCFRDLFSTGNPQFAVDYKAETLARQEFDAALGMFKNRLAEIQRFSADYDRLHQEEPEFVPMSKAQLAEVGKQHRKAKRAYEQYRRGPAATLTEGDLGQMDLLSKGLITEEQVYSEAHKKIKQLAKLKAEADALAAVINRQNTHRKAELALEAAELTQSLDRWEKDPSRLTLDRMKPQQVFRTVMGDENAQAIIDAFFMPIREHVHQSEIWKHDLRQQVRALKLSEKEAQLAQFLGECAEIDNSIAEGIDAKEQERQMKNHLKATDEEIAKARHAVTVFRALYDKIYEQLTEVLMANGYEAPEYRQNYFPHFSETDSPLQALAKQILGNDNPSDNLRTDIAGLTAGFKPGKKRFGNLMQRLGNGTVFDAVAGFERYINTAADVIFLTEDIQRARALEKSIRAKYTEDAIRTEIQAIKDDATIPEGEKTERINEVLNRTLPQGQHSNFVAWLTDYTNVLAGKKTFADRGVEDKLGRAKAYKLGKTIDGMIGAASVGFNAASAVSNLLPLVQTSGMVGTKNMAKAFADLRHNQDFVRESAFLSSRLLNDNLNQTKFSKGSGLMIEKMDSFTSQIITKGRYYHNLERGMSHEAALRDADNFAADLMASRAKGELPMAFENKNLISKVFTKFQVEVNNQIEFLRKDLPRYAKEEAAIKGKDWKLFFIGGLAKYILGTAVFNALFNFLFGKEVGIDPIAWGNNLVGDLAGRKINDVDGWISGEGFLKDTKKQGVGGAVMNLAENASGELPFVGPLLTAGLKQTQTGMSTTPRYAAGNAVPNLHPLYAAMTGDGDWGAVGKEAADWALGLVPGGGQLRKTVQGSAALLQGGRYNSSGNLMYPVERNVPNVIRGVVFGASAFPEADDYYDANSKPLSSSATAKYKAAVEGGMDPYEWLKIYEACKTAEGVKDKNGKTISGSVKAAKIRIIMKEGYTEEEATDLYNRYFR